jgi:hypothetical protein
MATGIRASPLLLPQIVNRVARNKGLSGSVLQRGCPFGPFPRAIHDPEGFSQARARVPEDGTRVPGPRDQGGSARACRRVRQERLRPRKDPCRERPGSIDTAADADRFINWAIRLRLTASGDAVLGQLNHRADVDAHVAGCTVWQATSAIKHTPLKQAGNITDQSVAGASARSALVSTFRRPPGKPTAR